MNSFIFLPSYITWFLLIFLVYAYVSYSFAIFFFSLIVYILIYVAFRNKKIQFQETIRTEGEIFLSPCFGTVKSVRLNVPIFDRTEIGHEVRIAISSLDPKGLYLPTWGEVGYLKATKGKRISREADAKEFYGPIDEVSHTNLTLITKTNVTTMLRFVDCRYGIRPTIWLKSGDRGRGAACFGYYPMGGTLFIYLPQNSDILVFESERVTPGQSVVAAIKNK